MKLTSSVKNNSFFLILVILGSLIRIFYGITFKPWLQAPDQLAWELILKEGGLSYSQLIHYPHEGGSILLSFVARFIQKLTSFHSLTIVAIIVDFFSRWIQLLVTKRLFNARVAALFGIWMVFSIPTIIPWGTVNYGLHSLSSFFPFLFLLCLARSKKEYKFHFYLGLFLGVSFWFYYGNLLLCFAYLIFIFLVKKQWKVGSVGLLGFCIIFMLHLLVRNSFDAGFHLQNFKAQTIRGIDLFQGYTLNFKNIIDVWFGALSKTSTAGMQAEELFPHSYILWGVIVLQGVVLGFKMLYKLNYTLFCGFLIFPIFILIYAVGPFYVERSNSTNYVLLRHLTYITPLIILLVVVGLDGFRFTRIVLYSFILLSTYNSVRLFYNKPSSFIAEEATGWVLGNKLGHSPKLVEACIEQTDYDKEKLYKGVGWGIATGLFENENIEDTISAKIKINIIKQLVNEYSNPTLIWKGVSFGFSDSVSPVLDREVYYLLMASKEVDSL